LPDLRSGNFKTPTSGNNRKYAIENYEQSSYKDETGITKQCELGEWLNI
jgi:hypothetical protein